VWTNFFKNGTKKTVCAKKNKKDCDRKICKCIFFFLSLLESYCNAVRQNGCTVVYCSQVRGSDVRQDIIQPTVSPASAKHIASLAFHLKMVFY